HPPPHPLAVDGGAVRHSQKVSPRIPDRGEPRTRRRESDKDLLDYIRRFGTAAGTPEGQRVDLPSTLVIDGTQSVDVTTGQPLEEDDERFFRGSGVHVSAMREALEKPEDGRRKGHHNL